MNRVDHFDGDDCEILRLFAGIACTGLPKVDALLQDLKTAAPRLERGIQVVTPENLHITLKFLGSAARSSVERIAAMMDRVAEGTSPIVITLTGAGLFTNALWLGVDPPLALNTLALTLDDELELLGFRAETRPYIPHLTLARLQQRPGSKLKAWIEERCQQTRASLQLRAIHLYQSETFSSGVRYSILHTAPLKRAD